jgi:hypothetical protein
MFVYLNNLKNQSNLFLGKETGTGKSDPYRFLSKGQQWIFLETNCQVQINSWTGKPESYICTTNPLQKYIFFFDFHLFLM